MVKKKSGDAKTMKHKPVRHGDLGDAHPLLPFEHEHMDRVCNKNCAEWVKLWLKWLISLDSEKNPVMSNMEIMRLK